MTMHTHRWRKLVCSFFHSFSLSLARSLALFIRPLLLPLDATSSFSIFRHTLCVIQILLMMDSPNTSSLFLSLVLIRHMSAYVFVLFLFYSKQGELQFQFELMTCILFTGRRHSCPEVRHQCQFHSWQPARQNKSFSNMQTEIHSLTHTHTNRDREMWI